MHMPEPVTSRTKTSPIWEVVLAGVVGSIMEWYDFTLYGIAAALVFNDLFFPKLDAAAATLASFSTLALGFVARPLGGIILGNLGDRVGRTQALVISVLLMGVATTLIGVLPTYQSIGAAAPALLVLLRLIQGVGAGGELGPAATMVAEYAPVGKRGFYASLTGSGVAMGVALAAGIFAALSSLPREQFVAWGWRIPFLLSALLVFAGLYIRMRVAETPVFSAVKATQSAASAPALEVVRTYRRNFLVAIGGRFAEVGPTYIFNTFAISYVAAHDAAFRSIATTGVAIAGAIGIFTIPAFGALSDRIGRRPVFIAGAVFVGLIAFPFFALLESGSVFGIWLAFILAIPFGVYTMFAVECSYFVELFGTRARASGISLARELSAPLIAGPGPLVSAALVSWTNSYWPVASLIVLMALITVVAIYFGPETSKANLEDVWSAHERELALKAARE
jgi:MFS transporter, MHS family, shikimate and dehydroshikimate transport protein